jgi:hypothetical protein
MPTLLAGYGSKSSNGEAVAQVLNKILFEPGHPRQGVPIVYDAKNSAALRGTNTALEVSCHPIVNSAGIEVEPRAARKEMIHPLD